MNIAMAGVMEETLLKWSSRTLERWPTWLAVVVGLQ